MVWNLCQWYGTRTSGMELVPVIWNSYQWYGTCASGMELAPVVWNLCQWYELVPVVGNLYHPNRLCLSLSPDTQDHSILTILVSGLVWVCAMKRES